MTISKSVTQSYIKLDNNGQIIEILTFQDKINLLSQSRLRVYSRASSCVRLYCFELKANISTQTYSQ